MNEKELMFFLKETDAKLQEYMSKEDYAAWAVDQGRRAYIESVINLPEGEFKDCCMSFIPHSKMIWRCEDETSQ